MILTIILSVIIFLVTILIYWLLKITERKCPKCGSKHIFFFTATNEMMFWECSKCGTQFSEFIER